MSDNLIVREYCAKVNIAALRTDDYDGSLDKFDRLFAAAQADFPTLKRSQAKVVTYGGGRIKRIKGLEFEVPTGAIVPDSYRRILQLEYTI